MKSKTEPESVGHRHRVLLVDDHVSVREGIAGLINRQSDLEVCGQAGTAAEGLEAAGQLKPDMVVADLSLESGSGLELIKNLKAVQPRLPVLVLSMHDEALYGERALRAGARGYVMKKEKPETMLYAIRTVLKNELFFSNTLQGALLHQLLGRAGKSRGGVAAMSDRELEIFGLIGEGATTRQIARRLRVSVSTVETHRGRIKEKLQLRNPAQLARAAVEWMHDPLVRRRTAGAR